MHLPDKQALATGQRMSQLLQLAIDVRKSLDQSRPTSDHTRCVNPPQHLVTRLALAKHSHPKHRLATPNHRTVVAVVLGQQHPVAHKSLLDQRVQLSPVAPGYFMQIVCRQHHATRTQQTRVPEHSHRLDRRRNATLHV